MCYIFLKMCYSELLQYRQLIWRQVATVLVKFAIVTFRRMNWWQDDIFAKKSFGIYF